MLVKDDLKNILDTVGTEKKKKICFVTSEAAPFIRSGGLGDVAGALPKELAKRGYDVRVMLPLYRQINSKYRDILNHVCSVYVTLAWRYLYCGIFTYKLDGVTYYFLDNEYYFNRDGLYGHYDDAERFAFFSKACLEVLPSLDFKPDIIHSNDWHSALVPVFLDTLYRENEFYANIRTVFTIHNIEFQGKYGKGLIGDILGIPEDKTSIIEYEDCTNYMKGAIESASRVTTVSPTYAKEIFDPYFSYGLNSILSNRAFKVSGIVNGIDYSVFNPATDECLFKKYDVNTFKEAKAYNKIKLLEMLNLSPANENTILMGLVTRLTDQKGLDIFLYALDQLMQRDIRIVILGKGDWRYENALYSVQERYKEKLRVSIDFSTDLANKIYAASDVFLMPSKFEPCGLSQLIAMRYGTIPIVRCIGGLKDTVEAYNPETKTGDGFTFYDYNGQELIYAVDRAIELFGNKEEWNKMVKRDMLKDHSWKRSAQEYINLYESI